MTAQFKLRSIITSTVISILLLNCCGNTQGAVTISPGMPLVCDGDRLELTCTVTDADNSLLEWTFAPITIFMDLHRAVTPSDQTSTHWMINATLFTFSRNSARNQFPLVSRLLIDPLTTDLNGIVVSCTAVPIMEMASTTVYVLNRLHNAHINKTEEFGINKVAITLKWTNESSYNVTVTPHLPFMFLESTGVQLRVPYNALYNVTALSNDPCGQTGFFEFYYTNCGNIIVNQTDDSIKVHGNMSLAIEGSNVTFSCPPGLVLTGPNTSTCMRNGEWEPDPQHLKCLAHCNPPPPPSNGQLLPYMSTLEGATVVYVCWSVHKRGQCEEVNMTAVCNKQGHWEPSTEDICAEPRGSLLSEDGKIAVASSVTTFVITSIVYFTFGYLCCHYQQKRTQTPPIPVINRTPVYENVVPEQNIEQDLELKENIAYGPIRIVH